MFQNLILVIRYNLLVLIVLFSLLSNSILSQEKKILNVLLIENAPRVDGELDDAAWENAPKASNFVMLNPGDGTPERSNQRSVVSVLYDNTAIYIGARLYDDEPSKILRELGERDDGNKNTDIFIFSLNPYNDGQQVFNFVVTAAGVQLDSKHTSGDEDSNWNAVWDSEVKIDDKGWVVEMRIPYSELRFPEKKEQVWGVNFLRTNKRKNEEYTWNYIDKKVGQFTQHYGELVGINNIKPPTRLSFMPYVSGYVDDYDSKTNYSYNLGMDLKYGINESFTLDMTLIPDFGQAAYDEQVLNLGPFEVRYDENRQFFTEGTEMFSKGNLFYSRRIGGVPTNYYDIEYGTDLDKNEILENPSKTPLINATKVSGRTKGGLGVGIFNAITKSTIARVKNKDDGEIQSIETEPLANYNVFVLDQRFNNNSSVTLINTNVTRSGEFRDANVTGLLFDLSNKANSYNLFGEGKYSYIAENRDSTKQGYQALLGIQKTKGKFRFSHETKVTSQDYDNTDLGYMRYSNILEIDTDVSYQIFEPTNNFNSFRFVFGVYHDRQFMPDHFIKVDIGLRGMATTLDFFSFGGDIKVSPVDKFDYYEPRVDGRYLRIPPNAKIGAWISTDFRKKFAIEISTGYKKFADWDKDFYYISVEPRYRVNDKFVVNMELSQHMERNDVGFVDKQGDDIIMGIRDQSVLESSIGSSFTFNNKMSMNLNFRHYWADIKYNDFKVLTDDGYLGDTTYNKNNNTTFNSWNVDLGYSWWFAPGSQISVLYRNSLLSEFDSSGLDYFENIKRMFENSPQNVFSIKVVYYLDYNNVKQMF